MDDVQHQKLGWVLWLGRVDYERAHTWQRNLVRMRREGLARDTIMMLEHPPVVTVGKSGHEENYIQLKDKAVFVERGGDVTYHGPGQLVVYYIFNLTRRERNLRRFMDDIQIGIIDTLAQYSVNAASGDEHTGIWVEERKIASIGIAVKNWITFHGTAINLNTDLKDFNQINPCGLKSSAMTSLQKEIGRKINMANFCNRLIKAYNEVFDITFEPVRLDELAEQLESQSGKNLI
jgi:lipoate-protein ligase B